MSKSSGLGFGGVLIGFGIGWMAIKYFGVSMDVVPYLLILAGIGIVASSLVFKQQKSMIGELSGGVIGGLIIAVVFSSVFGFANIFPFQKNISGSGVLITRDFNFKDFSAIEAGYGFTIDVSQGSEYSIEVVIDDNIEDKLIVRREDSSLIIGLEPGSYSNLNKLIRITMPTLNRLELSGGTQGEVYGFSSTNDFNLVLSGGSGVTMIGSSGDLLIDASGGSSMFLSDFTAMNLRVDLSGGSHGSVYASGRLDADLSGGSHLDYYGDPELGDIETSSGSSITPR
jgi:hypothetical protein